MRAILALLAAGFSILAQPALDVRELIRRTGERFFALENFDVELKIGHLGDRPMERRMRMARRDDGSMLVDTRNGYLTLVRDGRLIRIRDEHKEWTETGAEGQPMRSLQATIEPYITKYEKLVAVDFQTESLKWEELKRGGKRVECAVLRMRPRNEAEGLWKETLWIEPQEALVWRSLWEGTRVGAGGAISAVRQVDYEWRAAAAPIGDEVFNSEKLKRYRKVDRFTFMPMQGP